MIEPSEADLGREVIYRPRGGHGEQESGQLVGLSRLKPEIVFVRYGADHHSKATYAEDLEWAHS